MERRPRALEGVVVEFRRRLVVVLLLLLFHTPSRRSIMDGWLEVSSEAEPVDADDDEEDTVDRLLLRVEADEESPVICFLLVRSTADLRRS